MTASLVISDIFEAASRIPTKDDEESESSASTLKILCQPRAKPRTLTSEELSKLVPSSSIFSFMHESGGEGDLTRSVSRISTVGTSILEGTGDEQDMFEGPRKYPHKPPNTPLGGRPEHMIPVCDLLTILEAYSKKTNNGLVFQDEDEFPSLTVRKLVRRVKQILVS